MLNKILSKFSLENFIKEAQDAILSYCTTYYSVVNMFRKVLGTTVK